ncbi:ATP-binding protein [Anaeromyxobacter sp. Red801]|uniref:ATP-binding protein n=1 Tax=Anaeromyxobacter sp. Red801 TaxID=3411632 RepID=UPI003BA16908
MPPLTVDRIENAFLPAREITDPARFAGRAPQVEQAYLALVSEGANIAIVGNRGIGKSSLARQVIAISAGKTDLLVRHGIRADASLDFLSFYLACGKDTLSIDHLLTRLLTSHDCLAGWIYHVPEAKKIVEGYSPKFSAGLFGIGVELGGEKSTETEAHSAAPSADVTTVFTNVVSAMVKKDLAKNGILVVVDEFDQIRDPSGFASVLKSLATNVPHVRFCIVGVAHDLYALMNEHQSADRLFAGGVINLPSMTDTELAEVIGIAEASIDHEISFEDAAKARLVALAQGHPYMVHLVGKHSLRAAWKDKRTRITTDDIDATLRLIAASRADPVLEARYKRAIASSPQREAVLRAMAETEKGGEVWTSDAYPVAFRVGVENPSQYVGNLVTDEYGAELVKVRDRYYRFKDSLFRAYVLARPPEYASRLEAGQ